MFTQIQLFPIPGNGNYLCRELIISRLVYDQSIKNFAKMF